MKTILVIDDELINLTEVKRALDNCYKVNTADSGNVAFGLLEQEVPDLILLDINMPEMNGFQIIDVINRREDWKTVPVIMMSDEADVETEVKSFNLGAVDYLVKPIKRGSLLKRVERAIELETLRAELETQVAKKTEELERLTLQSITAFANVVDSKDDYTKGHSMRVAEYAVETARELGWSEEEVKKLHYAAILHDIGRVGIPESILNKRQALTESEFDLIKDHVYTGSEILKDISVVKDLANGAKYHHERYDGRG